MTYWEQECGEKSLYNSISSIINNKDVEIISDDKELFRVLKRHLTRKELHLFCMQESGKTIGDISARVDSKESDVELILRKARRKIKHTKVTKEIFIKKQ